MAYYNGTTSLLAIVKKSYWDEIAVMSITDPVESGMGYPYEMQFHTKGGLHYYYLKEL